MGKTKWWQNEIVYQIQEVSVTVMVMELGI